MFFAVTENIFAATFRHYEEAGRGLEGEMGEGEGSSE